MRSTIRWLLRSDRTLIWAAGLSAALVPITGGLALLDDRVLDGSNVWLKPLKFQVSMSVYLATLAAMVPLTPISFRRSLIGRATVWTAIVTAAFEVLWISGRAAFAVRSHYATDTAFGTTMYTLMAIAAVLLSLTPLVVAAAAGRAERSDERTNLLRRAAVLGASVSFVGAAVVGFLLGASPDHYPRDAHEVAARMPLTGWQLERGDLRIAHFVGLHALQGLLLAGLMLSRAPFAVAKQLLAALAAVWLLVTLALAAVALQGHSLFYEEPTANSVPMHSDPDAEAPAWTHVARRMVEHDDGNSGRSDSLPG